MKNVLQALMNVHTFIRTEPLKSWKVCFDDSVIQQPTLHARRKLKLGNFAGFSVGYS